MKKRNYIKQLVFHILRLKRIGIGQV